MERTNLNYWVDVLLVICLFVVGVTGLILKFAFVSGAPGVGRSVLFFGIGKIDFLMWHSWFALGMLALMVLHFVLHFDWLFVMTKKVFGAGE